MATPLLVCDLRMTLKNTYKEEQLKELDEILLGCGIDMEASKNLEIIPEADIEQRVEELAMEMADFDVLPWYLIVNTEEVIKQCFYRIDVFGEDMFFHSSFYRPTAVEVSIAVDGVKIGGVMDKKRSID